MAQLTHAIKFRILADQLNDDEFNEYMVSFIKSDGKSLFLRCLFTEFIKTKNKNGMKTVIKSTKIISNIIESRKIKQKQAMNKQSIHGLSNELIGELSSYLHQTDYVSFGQCNRSIYYAANSPNKLVHVNLLNLREDDYSSINLSKYRNIKKLEVCLQQLHTLKFPAKRINHLEALTLDNEYKAGLNLETLKDKLANINLNNLRFLKLINFGKYAEFATTYFNSFKFQKILQLFPNIKYYHFRKVYASILSMSDDDLLSIFDGLHGFAWNGCHISSRNRLLGLLGEQLNGLLFNQEIELDEGAKFDNLRELIVHQPPMNALRRILNGCDDLLRIHLDEIVSNEGEHKNRWSELLKLIMVKHVSLRLLSVHIDLEMFDDICKGIESGLTKAKDRKQLKLKLFVNCDGAKVVGIQNVFKIIDLLLMKTDTFMLYVAVRGCENVQILWSDLKHIRSNMNVNVYTEGDFMIVTNKQQMCRSGSFQMCPNLVF